MRKIATRMGTVVAALSLAALAGCAATATAPPGPKTDPHLLAHHDIRPESLPEPFASGDASNPPNIVAPPPDAKLALPSGFQIETYTAGDFVLPRWVVQAPNGDVF